MRAQGPTRTDHVALARYAAGFFHVKPEDLLALTAAVFFTQRYGQLQASSSRSVSL
jgi:hypothetical protein